MEKSECPVSQWLSQVMGVSPSAANVPLFGTGWPHAPASRTDVLHRWAQDHIMQPFPNKSVKRELSRNASMSLLQVNDWFKNYRRRKWDQEKLCYLLQHEPGQQQQQGIALHSRL